MEAHVQLPEREATNIVSALTGFADKAAKQSDRWWMSVLILIGIGVLGFMLKWHREDSKHLTEIFSTTLKSNTEAMTKIGVQLERSAATSERVERELTRLER